MEGIIPKLRRTEKRKLEKRARRCKEGKLKARYLIVLNLAEGKSPSETAKVLKVSRNTVYRVAARFHQWGEAGLVDRREENGQEKLTEEYLGELYEVVGASLQEYGWPSAHMDARTLDRNVEEANRNQSQSGNDEQSIEEDWSTARPTETNVRVNLVEKGEEQAVARDSKVD